MRDDHGSRLVTPEDRKRAIAAEFARTPRRLNITPGMRKALRGQRWRRWLREASAGFWWGIGFVLAVRLVVAVL